MSLSAHRPSQVLQEKYATLMDHTDLSAAVTYVGSTFGVEATKRDIFWEDVHNTPLQDSECKALVCLLHELPLGESRALLLHGYPNRPGPSALLQCVLILSNKVHLEMMLNLLTELRLSPAVFRASGLLDALVMLGTHEATASAAKALLTRQTNPDDSSTRYCFVRHYFRSIKYFAGNLHLANHIPLPM